jgi:8-amino-7-oxononanoate synthase
MSKRRGIETLSEEARQALIGAVQKAPAARARPAATAPAKRTSFRDLPGYEEMRVQRAAAAFFNISNPFYRLHEVRAGATSVVEGQPVINFASYDYLGLNGHPEIADAVREAVAQWGTSVSASRITAGERAFHRELERGLAGLYRADDAIAFVSGHATNISVIAQLTGPKDLILHDAFMHNSAVVGARLSGATRRIFAHNDIDALERILAAERGRHGRALIVTEGLFSMDGDIPDLARLIEIKNRYDAWLMVDDAHALGVLGKGGTGVAEHLGIDPRAVEIWMGTLSKTLVSCGGYVAGAHELIDYLKFTAPGHVYSVGMAPPAATAALTALTLMQREPERVARLQENGRLFLSKLTAAGFDTGTSAGFAVTPLILGDSLRTVVLSQKLVARGVNAVPIIPPGVPEKAARLRFFISATHTADQIAQAVAIVAEEIAALDRAGVSLANAAKFAAAMPKQK